MESKQSQIGGSSNTQIVYNGITYTDAKQIALDVFQDNIIELKEEAAQVAIERAEELSNKLIDRILNDKPESLGKFNRPDIQNALFEAQKAHAKIGDNEMCDILVDVLSDRIESNNRNMMQLVLDEALHTIPKLTTNQINVLTLNFVLARTIRNDINNLEKLRDYLNNILVPISDLVDVNDQMFSYFEYLGCGKIQPGSYGTLSKNFLNNYKAIFTHGFTVEELKGIIVEHEEYGGEFIQNIRGEDTIQIKYINGNLMDKTLKENGVIDGVHDDLRDKFFKLIDLNIFSENEVKTDLINLNNGISKTYEIWDNSKIKRLELSPVGIAIAHANYRRVINEEIDLSVWIH